MGFSDRNCNTDLPFCTPNTCLNEGTCVEGYGTSVSCICSLGIGGTSSSDSGKGCICDKVKLELYAESCKEDTS